MDFLGCFMKFAPFVAMFSLEFTDVGTTSLSKAAMREGMSSFVFVSYFNLLGTFLLLLPVLFSCRRKRIRLTLPLLCRFVVLGVLGSSFQMLSFAGINLSSPTLAAATGNLEPIFTLLLALTLRIEKFDLQNGLAVTVGSAICVSGALVVTLYKGPQLMQSISLPSSNDSSWILGGLLLTIAWIISALWHIFQTTTILVAPDLMINLFFFSLFSTIGSGIFSLCMIRDLRKWTPTSHIEIIAVVYTAIFGMIVKKFIHIWCLQVRGPIFVTMFRPLSIAIAMVIGIMFLGDFLYLGRIVGAIVIVVGFYIVMWGRGKQQRIYENEVQCPESMCQFRKPLLE